MYVNVNELMQCIRISIDAVNVKCIQLNTNAAGLKFNVLVGTTKRDLFLVDTFVAANPISRDIRNFRWL